MLNLIKDIFILTLVFLVLDGIWLVLVMNNHYNKLIMDIQGTPLEVSIFPAFLCYVVLIGGLYYFVVQRVKKFNILKILSLSIPFGVCVYGTFDFTSATMLKNWDMRTAFLDVIWGTFVCSVSVLVVSYLKEKNNVEVLEERSGN